MAAAARDAAGARLAGKANYAYAVFATDKLLQQSFAFPIKSGYYFSPVGTYACTVKTSQYKDENKATEEHAELVKAAVKAFSYESALIYAGRDQAAAALGKLTAVDTKNLLTVVTDSRSNTAGNTPLPTALARQAQDSVSDSIIDPLLKEVLEGYAESGTGGSHAAYKYREYTDKQLWLVEETTVITFTVAVPGGGKMYTHVNMPDGDYAVAARAGELRFDFNPYLGVPEAEAVNEALKMPGFTLEGITVTVRGSMYDDRR
jgi:hypothetical protein